MKYLYWPLLYPWIDENALSYFKKRLLDTPKDNIHALDIVLNYFNTYELQQKAFGILQFKLDDGRIIRVKKVVIPQRKYLGLSEQDEKDIKKLTFSSFIQE